MVTPRFEPAEPPGLADFAHVVDTGTRFRSDASLGREIVKILEAAHGSLSFSSQPVMLGAPVVKAALLNGNGAHVADHGARDYAVARIARDAVR